MINHSLHFQTHTHIAIMSVECNSTGSDTSVFSSAQSMENTPESTPIHCNEQTAEPSAKRIKKSTMSLIEEAMKYDMRSEYHLPTTFLRERRKPVKVETDDEDEQVNQKPKRKYTRKTSSSSRRVGRPRKDVTSNNTIKPIKPERKAKTKTDTKPIAVINKSKLKSKTTTEPKTKSKSKPKTNSKSVSNTYKDQTSEDNNSDMFLTDLDNCIENTSFFNLPLIRNRSGFVKNITSPKIFVENPDENNFVPLKSVVFPDCEERFPVHANIQKFGYDALLEIGQNIESAVRVYFPKRYKPRGEKLLEELNDTFEKADTPAFESVMHRFNMLVSEIPHELLIQELEVCPKIPVSFIHSLLHVCYTRSIYPNARKLKKYTSFSNFVYGELMPDFLTSVYRRCGLSSDSVFMDLGSGVGNCVIQAALEFGCKLSFGCEIMDSASDMTELQLKELENRCNYWGINLPKIEFSLRESFVNNYRVNELIPKCDVILINNFIFDAPLNKQVEKIIQNLKPGAKIISLKSIRPPGYSINYDDMDNIFNRLKVESFKLPENSVSWTYRSVGDYYISTVQDTIDESIFCPPIIGRIRKKESIHYTK